MSKDTNKSVNKKILKMSKRMRSAYEMMAQQNISKEGATIDEAVKILQSMPAPKFVGSLNIGVKLGIDPTKSDQAVRGAALMPSGMGKDVKVAVFAQGTAQKDAQAAGADIVIGDEDTAKSFIAGNIDVDACVATPDIMALLLKWGVSKVLGPKGLMPNAKVGTVTFDVKGIVSALKKGQATFKADKAGYLYSSVGLMSFSVEQLKDNVQAFLAAVAQAKPAAVKANFMQSVHLSASMCPSVKLSGAEYAHLLGE